jgi:hypothetical protein
MKRVSHQTWCGEGFVKSRRQVNVGVSRADALDDIAVGWGSEKGVWP